MLIYSFFCYLSVQRIVINFVNFCNFDNFRKLTNRIKPENPDRSFFLFGENICGKNRQKFLNK